MSLYFPVNRIVQGGASLNSPIASLIPLYPPFILPYLGATLLFVGLPFWAAFHAAPGEFESFALCFLAVTSISYLVYIMYPTYVDRPEVFGQDLFSRAIILLYRADHVHNAAPSGHTFYTVLSAIFLTRWYPRLLWIWYIVTILVLASTLFTRQHNLLDLACGLALAILVYSLVTFLRGKTKFNFAS
jgi:membrane-associated phospholipid phosphatase